MAFLALLARNATNSSSTPAMPVNPRLTFGGIPPPVTGSVSTGVGVPRCFPPPGVVVIPGVVVTPVVTPGVSVAVGTGAGVSIMGGRSVGVGESATTGGLVSSGGLVGVGSHGVAVGGGIYVGGDPGVSVRTSVWGQSRLAATDPQQPNSSTSAIIAASPYLISSSRSAQSAPKIRWQLPAHQLPGHHPRLVLVLRRPLYQRQRIPQRAQRRVHHEVLELPIHPVVLQHILNQVELIRPPI